MNVKVDEVIRDIVRTISSWECVDSLLLGESADEDVNDPYFFVSFDVYYHGSLPQPENRSRLFSNCGAFEFSMYRAKDRFLVQDVPVRVEYKDTGRTDVGLESDNDMLKLFRENGTYAFYRIMNGKIVYKRSEWIDATRERIRRLPDSFWDSLSRSLLRRTEHFLSDIGASVINNDSYFYLVSLTGFVRCVASFLYAKNRAFEPSSRYLHHRIETLPILPTNFRGHFGSLIRTNGGLPPEKIHEVATHLTRELIALDGV